jgi:hypothetical protein
MPRILALVFVISLALAPWKAMAVTTDGDITAGLLAALQGGSDTAQATQTGDLHEIYGSRN